MKMKPLSETNLYLRDKGRSAKLVTVSVSSSTAVELGVVSTDIINAIENEDSPQVIFYPLDQK